MQNTNKIKLNTFDTIEVKLLNNFDKDEEGDSYYKKGEIHQVCWMPNSLFYLEEHFTNLVINSNAKEGIDFKFFTGAKITRNK